MNNPSYIDARAQNNMASAQPSALSHQDQRSQQVATAKHNTSDPQQSLGVSMWTDPAFPPQHYHNAQITSQNSSFNPSFHMPTLQHIPSYLPVNFGNHNLQQTFDPGMQMLNNWTMANMRYNDGYAQGVQYPMHHSPSQQAPIQQTMAQLDQQPVDSDEIEDDPSAQLMAELIHTARSPTLEAVSAPGSFSGLEAETFKRFENESMVIVAEKTEERLLGEQVDQVVMDMNDEEMQDAIPEEEPDLGHNYVKESPYTQFLEAFDDIAEVDAEEQNMKEQDTEEQDTEEQDAEEQDIEEQDAEEQGLEEQYAAPDDSTDLVSRSDHEADDSAVEGSKHVEFEGHMVETFPFRTIKTKVMEREDKDLHNKAIKLIPHHLPADRYWIAVLMHTVQPHKAKIEKDFIWIKGHKTNTVETVWNKYREVTTEESHQVFFCSDTPRFQDTVEELDIFNDKLIVFRAFVKPKEVIEID